MVGVAPISAFMARNRTAFGPAELVPNPTFLRLLRNGVWVDTQLPIELLPGFHALAEDPEFRLDLLREHVIQDSQYSAVLRCVLRAELDLLSTLCRLHVDGQVAAPGHGLIDPQELRALLQGLLERLGGLPRLLRWAQVPLARFPAGLIPQACDDTQSGLWPEELPDAAAFIEVPIFQTTTGEWVSLHRILDHFCEHGTVAYSAYPRQQPDREGSLLLYASDVAKQDLLQSLFGSALECRDETVRAEWQREHNMIAWLRRPHLPKLRNHHLIARVALQGPANEGEVGIEQDRVPRPPWERRLDRSHGLHMLLIKDSYLLIEKSRPFPVPGLTMAVNGNFTPNDLYDDVKHDERFAEAIDALFSVFPALALQVASVKPALETQDFELTDEQRFRASVLRALLMLMLSASARQRARTDLGLNLDLIQAETPEGAPSVSEGESPAAAEARCDEAGPHPSWLQLHDWPLFETLDGTPLCPRDLAEAALSEGHLAVLCPSEGTSAQELQDWSALFRMNSGSSMAAEAWQRAHAQAPAVAPLPVPPRFILWLSSAERALCDELARQLPPTRILDAEPWLRTVAAVRKIRSQRRKTLNLTEDCALRVSLPGIEGKLGIAQETRHFRAFAQEPRVEVALFQKRNRVGSLEVYLPGRVSRTRTKSRTFAGGFRVSKRHWSFGDAPRQWPMGS
jgi:hypothetical protein